jgi:DNA-binding transcriptional MerR regulator
MEDDEIVIGVSQVANYLEISERTVRRMVKRGEFPKPIKEGNTPKGTRIWRKKDLVEFKKTLRKPGQRIAEQRVICLENRLTELEKENRELRNQGVPRVKESLFSAIENLGTEELLSLAKKIANSLGMELVRVTTKSTSAKADTIRQAKEEEEEWEHIRQAIEEKSSELGSRRKLGELTGIPESTLRMFVKGKIKTLRKDTLNKLKKVFSREMEKF